MTAVVLLALLMPAAFYLPSPLLCLFGYSEGIFHAASNFHLYFTLWLRISFELLLRQNLYGHPWPFLCYAAPSLSAYVFLSFGVFSGYGHLWLLPPAPWPMPPASLTRIPVKASYLVSLLPPMSLRFIFYTASRVSLYVASLPQTLPNNCLQRPRAHPPVLIPTWASGSMLRAFALVVLTS